jgi:hypothetical protein
MIFFRTFAQGVLNAEKGLRPLPEEIFASSTNT